VGIPCIYTLSDIHPSSSSSSSSSSVSSQLADDYLVQLNAAVAERDDVVNASDVLQSELERTLGTAERLRTEVAALRAGKRVLLK
jgi:hypothetical protein